MRTATTWARRAGLALLAALLLAACANTRFTSQWKSPDYSGGPMRKVLVVGVSKQPSVRRTFEDEFVARLEAAGVDGIQSYTVLPDEALADRAALEAAVKSTGADGVLVVRLVRREQQTQVVQASPAAPPTLGFYGWYSGAWSGYYEPATTYQYELVSLEASLYSPAQANLVWSATTEGFAPTNLKKDSASYADLIIDALRKDRIL